ncbi:MAG: hypothetical protein ACT4PP_12800 [Sporichthyaceae bacterium]
MITPRVLMRATAGAVLALLGATLGGPGAAAADKADTPKEVSAQAQAVVARIVPFVGLPGVTTSIGLAGAQVSAGSAQANATAADFGLLGALAAAGAPTVPGVDAPDLPQPIVADSAGVTSAEREQLAPPPGQGMAAAPGTFARERVDAGADPLAARSRVDGPQLLIPGLLELSSGSSTATARAERAVSEVRYGRIALGEGEVVLTGLRWVATQRGSDAAKGTFTLGSMTIAGQSYAVDSPAEIASAIAQANSALVPFGLALSAPTSTLSGAGATVAPLIIQVRNPEPLVEPSRQGVDAFRPVLTPLIDAIIAAYPDAAAAQIALNAVVGGLGGSSGGRLELGGVSARFGLVDGAALPLDVPDTASVAEVAPPPPGISPTTDAAGEVAAGIAEIPPALPGAAPAPAGELTVAAPVAGTVFGEDDRTRTLVFIGLGLLLIIALAAGDRIRLLAAG